MAVFKDSKGREWQVCLNLGTARQCKRDLGFDFMAGGEDHPILKLSADVVLLGDVLWALCQKQAVERGVTEQDFAEGLLGDSLDAATDALSRAFTDFCPNPKRRETLARLWAKLRDVEDLQLERAARTLETLPMNKPPLGNG
jgi:hypothetical protein